jgi:hypothetical protein
VRAVGRDLAADPALGGRRVLLRLDLTPGVPPLLAGRGPERLEQVLAAVLRPVARATAPGEVVVRLSRGAREERWVGLRCEILARRAAGAPPPVAGVSLDEVRGILAAVGSEPETRELAGGGGALAFELAYHAPIGRSDRSGHRILDDDARNVAIGQGPVSATPLQMARAMAVLANGGRLVTPRLVRAVDGVPLPPISRPLGLDAAWIDRVRAGMRAAVTSGTAAGAAWDDVAATVYGKTGTAQTGAWWKDRGPPVDDGPWHHWFVGFAEAPGRPPLAFACVLHARTEKSAGHTAVHAVRDFLVWWTREGPEAR